VTNTAAKLYEDDSSKADVEGQVQELYRRAQNADSRRWQEVSAAFVFGCLSFLVGFGVIFRGGRSDLTEGPNTSASRGSHNSYRIDLDADEDPVSRGQIFEMAGRRQAMI